MERRGPAPPGLRPHGRPGEALPPREPLRGLHARLRPRRGRRLPGPAAGPPPGRRHPHPDAQDRPGLLRRRRGLPRGHRDPHPRRPRRRARRGAPRGRAAGLPRDGEPGPGDAPGVPGGAQRRRDRRHRAGPRRERLGQGAGGPGAPRREPEARGPLRPGELRRPHRDPHGVRALRACARRLHRGGARPQGPLRAGRRRHPLPRRGRRAVARGAGEAPAGPRGPGGGAGGGHRATARRRAGRRRHPPVPARGGGRPGGSAPT